MLSIDREEFHNKFNRAHFMLEHELANFPEFELPHLIELAKQISETRPSDLYYDVGDAEIGQRWEDVPRGSLPIDETIRRIETQNAWIFLRRTELHPAYSRLLSMVMSDIFEMTGPEIDETIKRKEVILFITSPKRTTTYHIDRECNFLLQISGKKQISVFRREDREVLPEIELERFWTVDNNAATYRQSLQPHAEVFELKPGNGIHIPVNAPHWLKNDDNISITASFNFQFRDNVRANLYRANYYLRKFGFDPGAPFRNHLVDALKRPFGAATYKARQIYRGPGPQD